LSSKGLSEGKKDLIKLVVILCVVSVLAALLLIYG
jgi:hypothetical protein